MKELSINLKDGGHIEVFRDENKDVRIQRNDISATIPKCSGQTVLSVLALLDLEGEEVLDEPETD